MPEQGFTHFLNPRRGMLPGLHYLCFTAALDSAVAFRLPAGRCVHVDPTSNKFMPGAVGPVMPLFVFQNSDDTDVKVVDDSSPSQWQSIEPGGGIMGMVATGAYELETTEFDTTKTYAANDLLRAPGGNLVGNAATSGVLTNDTVVLYTNTVVGIASGPAYTNAYGVKMLPFWPVCLLGSA